MNYDPDLARYIYPYSISNLPGKKAKKMDSVDPKEFPYQIEYTNFKTLAAAEAHAKRLAAEEHEDVVIKQRVSVVRFPLPDLKVEKLDYPAAVSA